MADKIYTFNIAPGMQRDGTEFAATSCIDGQWVRWQRGLPQKMGGYKQIGSATEVPRGTFVVPASPNFNVYYGTASQLKYIPIDQFANPIAAQVDRTPVPFQADVNNDWQFDSMFSSVDDGSILIAFAAPNLAAIDSNVERPIYYGDQFATTPLIPTGIQVSGGIVVLHPFLFMFGNDGEVAWSEANNPTVILDSARVTASKICVGMTTRGGNTSPAGLLWSLDSLIRVTNVGTEGPEFNFDTVSSESSLLSSRGVIEMDGRYYWAATDRFLIYNGVVQELPNDKSINYFFRNVNYAQRQKVWATKVTQYGEIIWFFPTGNNTECNHAVIYNTRENTWYDTEVFRSDGYFDQTFAKPIWADNQLDVPSNSYPIWAHEINHDKVFLNGTVDPILSSFTGSFISWASQGPDSKRNETDRWVELYRFEPDMIQTGLMSLTINTRRYARSQLVSSTPYLFFPDTEKIDLREQGREMSLTFSSNSVGGYYEMGQSLLVGRIGDGRQ